ncbi:hypothetical protein ACE1OC_05820 [Streptomyces sp. DSM 116496]|uniref:hypothetical protein n=1 Tax=Streptomyces stoeckheimensis TaxID=3344656 RepID=UPI0038B30AC9
MGDATFEPGPCPKTADPVAELEGARCGTLTVPENRTKPDSRRITLGVAIVAAEAAQPKPDPIVWLSGGPGDDAVGEAKMAIGAGLNRHPRPPRQEPGPSVRRTNCWTSGADRGCESL